MKNNLRQFSAEGFIKLQTGVIIETIRSRKGTDNKEPANRYLRMSRHGDIVGRDELWISSEILLPFRQEGMRKLRQLLCLVSIATCIECRSKK